MNHDKIWSAFHKHVTGNKISDNMPIGDEQYHNIHNHNYNHHTSNIDNQEVTDES